MKLNNLKPDTIFKKEPKKPQLENFQALVPKHTWDTANKIKDKMGHSWPEVAQFGLLCYIKKFYKTKKP